MVLSFKSIFLVSVPNLAFNLPKAHSIRFLADLADQTSLLLFFHYSFMQYSVKGYAGSPIR